MTPSGTALLPKRAPSAGSDLPEPVAIAVAGGSASANVWAHAAPLLCHRFGQANFARWLEPLAAQQEGRRLALATGDRVHAQRLRQHFLPGIAAALREVGFEGEVAIVATEGASPEADVGLVRSAVPPPRATGPDDPVEASTTRPSSARYTFEEFVVGESNRLAHDAGRSVADRPARVHNPLYVHGGVGRGKTHLAMAVAHAIEARVERGSPLIFSADRFLSHISAPDRPAVNALCDGESSVAVFDDVQLLARDEAVLDELFRWIDELIARGAQVVLTCDLPPPRIPSLAARLHRRCEAVFAAEILAPDIELRREIVRRRAAASGAAIDEGAVEIVAAAEGSSVRALEGAFNRVCALAASTDGALTAALARRALAGRGEPGVAPGLDAIAAAVAAAFDISLRDLRARRRKDRAASLARQVAVHLARRLSGRPLGEIAVDLGYRDHSAAAHAWAAVDGRLAADLDLAQRIGEIERRLGNRSAIARGPARS